MSCGEFDGFFRGNDHWYGPGEIMDICVVRVRLVRLMELTRNMESS